MKLLYRRENNPERGRHLVADKFIEEGCLILAERPLLALQSLDNLPYNQVCHSCKAFVGGPDKNLLRRAGNNPVSGGADEAGSSEEEASSHAITVPCRKECGYVYCSRDCEADAWDTHHAHLCTGECESLNDPIARFKQYCVETNEILLLVAEWWVAQHNIPQRHRKAEENNKEECSPPSSEYTDFQMNPWWDVVTADLIQQPGAFGQAAALQSQLRRVCPEAAELLNEALVVDAADGTTGTATIPCIAALDIARRVGACEQNAMGIRQRSPLCRDIFDASLRRRRHQQVIHCLAEAGFIGKEAEEITDETSCNPSTAQVEQETDKKEVLEEWDYSVEEIASFLANLHMDEDGSVRDSSAVIDAHESGDQQDDLDILFPPLDGTAMYSIACKMNHSCDPNVILVYRCQAGWGPRHPLTAFCVALRDIQPNEELTISYIHADEPYDKRQAALANYGFSCHCQKCEMEKSGNDCTNQNNVPAFKGDVDVFGSDSDEDNDNTEEESMDEQSSITDGDKTLQNRLERLDSAVNHSKFGSIPVQWIGQTSSFVSQMVASLVSENPDSVVLVPLKLCREGFRERDFCLCKISGLDIEAILYSRLRRDGQFQSVGDRQAYWCGVLSATLGLIHEYNFLEALYLIDKAIILGLPCRDEKIRGLIEYVEFHAQSMAEGANKHRVSVEVSGVNCVEQIEKRGLSSPIHFPVLERATTPSFDVFKAEYLSRSRPVVIRGLAAEWTAVSEWRRLDLFVNEHGHRVIPVELGSMIESTLEEDMMSLRNFVESYMVQSSEKGIWSLQDCLEYKHRISYLAQHPLLHQISSLRKYVEMNPALCGPSGPTEVYVWVGTGGTRTPLHYDSYDNLFVQIVGTKYVRLYDYYEISNLHISSKSVYGLQGNMSDLDCEQEDWSKHPEAKSAKYEETILFPGDAMFVPARTWHYVRAMSSSISVNYWY